MTDLDRTILKLRVCFHKRLSDQLGLKIDVKRIEELSKQWTDEEVFRLIEIEGQKRKIIRLNPFSTIIRIARDSKIIKRLSNPSFVTRFKSFIKK